MIQDIEIVAVEMAIDTVLRFSDHKMIEELSNSTSSERTERCHMKSFVKDFVLILPHIFQIHFQVKIASDEARHFSLLEQRMADYATCYGDIPSHDHLWSIAHATKEDLLGRIAVLSVVYEDSTAHSRLSSWYKNLEVRCINRSSRC